MKLAIVVGNPKPMSRTRTVAEAVGERVAVTTGADLDLVVDLADHAASIFTWPEETLDGLGAAVAASDLAVFATPTYKASYTGLLKAFLDRFDADGLAGVTAIPVMTGGSPAHSLALDTTLRPLLAELGASLPTRGLYFIASEIDQLAEIADRWAERNLTAPPLLGPMSREAGER